MRGDAGKVLQESRLMRVNPVSELVNQCCTNPRVSLVCVCCRHGVASKPIISLRAKQNALVADWETELRVLPLASKCRSTRQHLLIV